MKTTNTTLDLRGRRYDVILFEGMEREVINVVNEYLANHDGYSVLAQHLGDSTHVYLAKTNDAGVALPKNSTE